jgi:hypothetical protein
MWLHKKEIFKALFLVFLLISAIFNSEIKAQTLDEKYNPTLGHLNSLEKLNTYIDSIVHAQNIIRNSSKEVFLVNKVIEDRFYHGFSHYSIKDNFIAFLAGKYIWENLSAVVISDDILKHPQAACSQQAIVMMELLKYRGYPVRKLHLSNHFILEVFFDNDWKVFDPNKEPTLQGFSHNSIPLHLQNGDLNKAYNSMSEKEVNYMYKITKVGKVNEFPARNARIFHLVTKYLSQYFLVFLTTLLFGSWLLIKRTKNRTRQNKKNKSIVKKVSECQQSALAN